MSSLVSENLGIRQQRIFSHLLFQQVLVNTNNVPCAILAPRDPQKTLGFFFLVFKYEEGRGMKSLVSAPKRTRSHEFLPEKGGKWAVYVLGHSVTIFFAMWLCSFFLEK